MHGLAKTSAKNSGWICKNILQNLLGTFCSHTSRTKRIFMVAATSICGPKTADFDAKIALKEVPFTPTEITARRIWQMIFANMSPNFCKWGRIFAKSGLENLQIGSGICKIHVPIVEPRGHPNMNCLVRILKMLAVVLTGGLPSLNPCGGL